MDVFPNSYNHNPEEEPRKYRPEIHKGTDKEYPRPKAWPRAYHKYLNTQTRNDIYGVDEADRLYGVQQQAGRKVPRCEDKPEADEHGRRERRQPVQVLCVLVGVLVGLCHHRLSGVQVRVQVRCRRDNSHCP